ncbi:hypothetical protein CACET_c32660 [Clostridium aceticum]|uniref:Uncharacterized protein n=1 Tax=Clostridium aceticum TaxID=84022 RepID=A0A0D8IBL5_9CLOT|nr:hypothetical protein [Clostridium aceticum]AKL96710.1 hypothetical protein CACET_c32660 [Clostridium aceticum]KJF27479.1 hypothetical protein TZ02_06695 [Clostridium aceticum]
MPKVTAIFSKDQEGIWRQCKELVLELLKGEDTRKDLSFITDTGYEQLQKDKIRGFCHEKFMGNFVIEELDMSELLPNTKMAIGSVTIDITDVGKKCHKGCPALAKEHICTLSKHIFFGRPLEAGRIQVNNLVKIESAE